MPSEKSVTSQRGRSDRNGKVEFSSGSGTSWTQSFLADFAGVFLLFLLTGIERLPAVNEPHYWTKASHFWDPEFGRGDLFLESANAHWLFYATFGGLTRVLPIEYAVWLGRLCLWGLLAGGWTWMMRQAFLCESQPRSRAWVGTLTAAAWCTAVRWGHLAGEWVVGGSEAKVAAYAMVFMAFGFFFARRWTFGWACLGVACAFHVVVGLWVFLGSLLASFVLDRFSSEEPQTSTRGTFAAWWLKHGWGLPLAVLGLGIGMLPPLLADSQATAGTSTQAAMIQVYKRLGHHLAPSAMAWVRWRSFGGLFLLGGLVWILALASVTSPQKVLANKKRPKWAFLNNWGSWPYGLRWFLIQAVFGILVGLLGCLVDWGSLGGIWSRELAAKVLKYYWFRWNDVAMGLWVAAASVWIAGRGPLISATGKSSEGGLKRFSVPEAMLAAVLIFGIWGLIDRIRTRGNDWLGEGERARLLSKSDGFEEQLGHYQDWLNVCRFVKEQTPPGSLWLTPRNQQTFKWHTGRGEVAAWKDMPQDAAAVVEWFHRLEECYPVDSDRSLKPWTTEKILELHKRYSFRYVLIDRRIDGQSPPLLPLLYPKAGEENSTFAVFEIPR